MIIWSQNFIGVASRSLSIPYGCRQPEVRLYGLTISSIYVIITINYMAHQPTSTARARRLRERRSRGVVMVAPVEGGVEFLVGNGLLKQDQADDRHAVGAACLAELEQWAEFDAENRPT